MAIGKNAIKRVENNGYSKVQTSAPDMEHSHVIANPDKQVTEVLVAPVEEAAEEKSVKATATKKTTAKKPTAKKTTAKKPTAKKTAAKKTEAKKDGVVRVEVGEEMPYYLL